MRQVASALALIGSLAAGAAEAQVLGGPPNWRYAHITTDATTTIKGAAGVLHTICINNPSATETIVVYDSLAGSGTVIASITLVSTTQGCFLYDASFTNGLTVVTAVAASDITFTWN